MKRAFLITVTLLSVIIFIMGVYIYKTNDSLTNTSASLEGIYQRSLYDLNDNVNNMEVEVSKLMVTNDSVSQQRILSNLKMQSSDAENSLSFLPVNNSMLSKANKFMNQLNGYCSSLITYSDAKIGEEDYEKLSQIHASIIAIKEELNNIIEKIMEGYRISDNSSMNEDSDFNVNFSPFYNETIKYPSLIYDGPFSDATVDRTVKGLKGEDIDRDSAERIVSNIFGDSITSLNYLDETTGTFDTFDFGVNTKDRNFYIQVAKKGGFLLNMSSNVSNNKDRNSDENVEADSIDDVDRNEQAINLALEFANKLNIPDMQSVWSASSESVCYVNLAPVQDECILYPDLIKAKIDLNNMSVVGWEASSYALNHVEREDLIPQLSKSEAKALISGNLDINNERLCVIPLDYVGETLAYEFSGMHNGYHYYLYIDAYTGNQVRVLRVIQTDQGELIL